MGDLPDIAVGIGERPGSATPFARPRPDDRATGPFGLGEDGIDLPGGAAMGVAGELYRSCQPAL